jgi:hypothetical protein
MMQNFEPRRRKDAGEFMINLFFLRLGVSAVKTKANHDF